MEKIQDLKAEKNAKSIVTGEIKILRNNIKYEFYEVFTDYKYICYNVKGEKL